MLLIILYLLSIPLAMMFVIVVWIEDRSEFIDYDGGWWESFKYALRWSDIATGLVIGLIPILNSVAALVCIVALLACLWDYVVGDLLSRPVFSRKVVIKLNKD